jgi:hypothetical protein
VSVSTQVKLVRKGDLPTQERVLPVKNRRKGPDWLVSSMQWLSLAGWAVFVIALGLSHLAKPEMNSGLVRYWGLSLRDYWDPELLPQLIYLLWWCCLISLLSILLNQFRMRRATDRFRYNFLALLFISLGALSYFYQV